MPNAERNLAEKSRLECVDWFKAALDRLALTKDPSSIKIDVLCRHLGVTKGSFYWHFKGREDLIEGLITYWSGQFHHEVQEGLGAVPSDQPIEFLRALTKYWRSGNFMSTDAAMRRWAMSDQRVAAAIASGDRIVMDRLVDVFQALGKTAEDAKQSAYILMAMGVAAPQLTHLQPQPPTKSHEQDLQHILTYLLGE